MKNLKTVNVFIEYFEDDREVVESLLWRLAQESESFSSTYEDDRMVYGNK
jgi:uncharacterized membrane protein YvbJ